MLLVSMMPLVAATMEPMVAIAFMPIPILSTVDISDINPFFVFF